jgi:hypothetical protein
MILTGENRRARRKACPSATLSITNPTWTHQRAYPGLRGGRLATSRLSSNGWLRQRTMYHWSISCCIVRMCFRYCILLVFYILVTVNTSFRPHKVAGTVSVQLRCSIISVAQLTSPVIFLVILTETNAEQYLYVCNDRSLPHPLHFIELVTKPFGSK